MIKKLLITAAVVSSFPALLLADAIDPATFTGTVDVGGSVTIHKTVTVAAGTPTTSKVDVVFLADNTGSMGTYIDAVKASASSILASSAGLGDVAFGVASYEDFGYDDIYGSSPAPFAIESNITTSASAANSAISKWVAEAGNDYPESYLYALDHVATDMNWRDGATKIVVMFGDAPSHDPAGPDAAHAVTETMATTALVNNNVKVEALNVGGGGLNDYGQASRITAATGGTLYSGINNSTIVAAINSAITTSFNKYNTVSLGVVGADNVTVTTTDPITGTFDRSKDNTFKFDVTVTGATAGVDDFDVNALVDGGIVATEKDHITVTGGTPSVPEPGSLTLLSFGLLSLAGYCFRRKK